MCSENAFKNLLFKDCILVTHYDLVDFFFFLIQKPSLWLIFGIASCSLVKGISLRR